MSKNIIFCADGTWNHPLNPAEVSGQDTNVFKIYMAFHKTDTQLTFYDKGVGVSNLPIRHWLGGIFGDGIFQKIKDGYREIARHYVPGDRICIFGFSRGAYTARSLAGMIAICGLPTRANDAFPVDRAFQAYRNKDQREAILAELTTLYQLDDAKIAMLGVWDTVGALGIPGMFASDAHSPYEFLDTTLHPDVKTAYHAVSIDERRRPFTPTLWTSAPAPGQIMQQVWFSGVHADVGGGYAETGLSDITLGWMLNKAITQGLDVTGEAKDRYLKVDPKNALGLLHKSWAFYYGFPKSRTVPPPPATTLANSVPLRLAAGIDYDPSNLNYDPAGGLDTSYGTETVV